MVAQPTDFDRPWSVWLLGAIKLIPFYDGHNKHWDLTGSVVAFFSPSRNLGECSTTYSMPALFFFFFSFFFLVEISSHTLIPLLRPGSVHSGSVS